MNTASLIAAFSVGTCGALLGADQMNNQYREVRPARCKPMAVKPEKQNISPTIPCPPLAGDPTDDGYGVFITADALAWAATEQGLAYTILNNAPIANFQSNGTNLPNAHARVKHADGGWAGGFRLGAGYHLPKRKWDLSANWTWYQLNTKTKINANADQGLFLMLADVNSSPDFPNVYSAQCTNAQAKWNLHYNVIDVDLNYMGLSSKFFAIRPHLGIKSAWIHQKFNVNYLNFSQIPFGNFFGGNIDVNQRNHFWGCGLRGGFDTVWNFWKCFSFYANGAYSLLFGHFDVNYQQFVTLTNGVSRQDDNVSEHYRAVRANLEYGLGLRWDVQFSEERYHLGFCLGWEEQLWINQNQMLTFVNAQNAYQFYKQHGDLGLSGITFNARFDF